MKLWDILEASQYMQVFSVYVTNVYGQNIPIARGTLLEMWRFDPEWESNLFYHMMDDVHYFHITGNGIMVLYIRDKHYEEPIEKQYSEDYVKRWDKNDPMKRPYLFYSETEENTDKWICRFPCEMDKAESEAQDADSN